MLDIPTPPAGDYATIRRALEFVTKRWRDQPSVEDIADHVGLSASHLQYVFKRWAGLTPKAFLQAITIERALELLRDSATVLDASYEVGLSGPGRLHDLFVTYEAMPPGVFRAGGAGIDMIWGVAPSPFGLAVVTATEYGISGLGFADQDMSIDAAFADLANRWPNARFSRDDARIVPLVAGIFEPSRWSADHPVRVVLIGTDFEVKVWETLLKIPCGRATTYSDVARSIGKPSASRAVGAAVGKNPISFVVPCHRVVGTSGALTGYHWGVPRKRAILGWEAGVISAAH